MNLYNRIFGAGPRGAFLSIATLFILHTFESTLSASDIHNNEMFGWWALAIGVLLTLALIVWSVKSLSVENRGRKLITTGAFKYFRHPLYAAFINFFNLGLALWFDNWIYIIWWALQYPIWQWNITSEERLMEAHFGDEYREYCKKTGRFLPWVN